MKRSVRAKFSAMRKDPHSQPGLLPSKLIAIACALARVAACEASKPRPRGKIWILCLSPRRLGVHVSEIRRFMEACARDRALLNGEEVPAA
jgi:hypothetical protein